MKNTSLHYAAANGNEAILTYLLDKNAQITISANGNTPLHVVSRNFFVSLKKKTCYTITSKLSYVIGY